MKRAYKHYSPPLRLLKEFSAPVLYVKDWGRELETLLEKEARMSEGDRIVRRKRVVKWYGEFKASMRDKLVRVIRETFFNVDVGR